jgi:hypothetical protein
MSTRIRSLFALLAAASTTLSSHSEATRIQDEQLASRFLYCAYVSTFWYEYLTKNEPSNPGINGYRQGRNAFWMAAALVSDGDFITKEKGNAQRKVVAVLEDEKSKKTDLMSSEAASCADTLQNRAVPLLQANLQKAEPQK